MSPNRFQHLLELVRPLITKKDTKMRKAITAEERLAVTFAFWQRQIPSSLCTSHLEWERQQSATS